MKIITEITVAASVDRAWQVLAEQYGDAAVWTSALQSTSMKGTLGVGAIRTCHSRAIGPFPASVVEEQLIEFSPDIYQFTYIAERGLPGIFKSAKNTWSMQSVDEKSCKIRSHVTMKTSLWIFPVRWIIPWLIKRDLNKIFDELTYYIEHDELHPRKIQANLEPMKS